MPLILEKHKEMDYYIVNFDGCNNQIEMIEELMKIGRYFKRFPETNSVYAIIDVRDTPLGTKFMDKAIELNRVVFSTRAKAIAVLGATGIKKILLVAFNKISSVEAIAKSTKLEAKEYLWSVSLKAKVHA